MNKVVSPLPLLGDTGGVVTTGAGEASANRKRLAATPPNPQQSKGETVNVWPFLAAAFGIGIGAGAIWMAWLFKTNSFDVFEVTSPDGYTYLVADVCEVEAALKVDGMLAVRRLRVLA